MRGCVLQKLSKLGDLAKLSCLLCEHEDVGNLIYFWQSVVMSLGVPGYKNQFYNLPTAQRLKPILEFCTGLLDTN